MVKEHTCVLLIDDAEIDNFINENIIKAVGISYVHVFKSGQSAIEFLENLQRNISFMRTSMPQIVFLDLNMPLMNGFQFLNEFEKFDDAFKDEMKFVILTSSHDPEDVKLAQQNKRVIKYLNKPLSEEDVKSIVSMICTPSN